MQRLPLAGVLSHPAFSVLDEMMASLRLQWAGTECADGFCGVETEPRSGLIML